MTLPQISDLHFLRPAALWLLLPILALYAALLWRRGSTLRRWKAVIAPHLLKHLLLGAGRSSFFSPMHLLALVLGLATLAVAGPSWQREASPFSSDTAGLVIVIDLSSTMLATDLRPSRYERACQKARDLLSGRKGSPTALVAYAGTAHRVLPLTDDPGLLTSFVDSLSPGLMPVEGQNAAAALARAEEILADEPVAGTILFLTDGIPAASHEAFIEHRDASRHQVMVLAVGWKHGGPIPIGDGRFLTDSKGSRVVASLDIEGLETLSHRAGVEVQNFTIDDSDVRRLQRSIQSHLVAARLEDPESRWRDEGYWLVIPIALVSLLWFRRGWLVSWEDA